MADKVLFSWSGGKDSALALYRTLNNERYEVAGLLTTVNEGYRRISLHGVLESLLEQQAESIGLPMHRVYLPQESSNEEYEARMERELRRHKESGVSAVAFGDIFLFEIKKYREENLKKIGMKGLFPLWGQNTTELAGQFVALGFKAIVTCVDPKQLDPAFAGGSIDGDFLKELPSSVDPCGENGEYHSFVFDGPNFKQPVACTVGKAVMRDSFYFCDVLPG